MRQGQPSGACTVSGAVRLVIYGCLGCLRDYCFDGGCFAGRVLLWCGAQPARVLRGRFGETKKIGQTTHH